ncbi:MAG TPA: winged helix-turn-helix transcriptional regulator [Methanocella sp.]|nr:winged helix-turn-helix transcriptional regulator [Methanocella sp.]
MDAVDFLLLKKLTANSRATFRELAVETGLSASSVHKRVRVMTDLGIIRRFTASPTPKAVPHVCVCVCGTSEAAVPEEAAERIGASPLTFRAMVASGNYLCVKGILRDISEMSRYVGFVIREGSMKNPIYGLMDPVYTGPAAPLSRIDYRILASLQYDSRKDIADVAIELGISAQTARRRLGQMEKSGLVNYSINYDLTPSGDIFAKMSLFVKSKLDRDAVASQMLERYSDHVLYLTTYGTISSLITIFIWTKTMASLRDLQDSLYSEDLFEKLVLDTPYKIYYFDTWLEAHVSARAVQPSPARSQ